MNFFLWFILRNASKNSFNQKMYLVVVSWWETTITNQTNQTKTTAGTANQTSDVPVARISNDAGVTFGPMLMLGMNGTISETEEDEEEGESAETTTTTATFGGEGETG
ncbi:MAG: hypothetical protein M3115_04200 [Thermoproteota archaeon]|nr:hypothetical protein [Thermoproteota archaeon]